MKRVALYHSPAGVALVTRRKESRVVSEFVEAECPADERAQSHEFVSSAQVCFAARYVPPPILYFIPSPI